MKANSGQYRGSTFFFSEAAEYTCRVSCASVLWFWVYWRYKLTDLLRHTYLTHTMCFINDKTCQELPLIQILQSGNQPVTCTDLDQRQGRVLNAHLNDTVTTIQSLPIKLAHIYEENRSKQQRGHFSMLAHIQQFYLQVSGSNFCLPQRIWR